MAQAEQTPQLRCPMSTLMLSDQMLTLAQMCDGAGLRACAGTLVSLACAVLDEAPAH